MRAISAIAGRPEERASLRHLAGVRWGLLLAAMLLAGIGLATVHSASAELGIDYLPRQAAWIGIGLALFVVAFSFDHQALAKLSGLIYALGLLGLLLVLLAGREAGGAQSWLGIAGFRVQPSDFARVTTAIFLARYLAGATGIHLGFKRIVVGGLIVLAPMTLIALQPDLGSAVMFAPLLVGMLLVAGVRWQLLVAGLLLLLIVAGLAWTFVLFDYQRERIVSFLSPGSDPLGAGYQLRQSKIAVGSGELIGKGYMQGTQSHLRFLPARHTDFIFAVLAEEWGFLGVLTVLALYAFYVYNGALVARRARDRVGILLVVGLLSVFSVYVLYNTAMVVGLLPITGIPLPFLSYGGSFMLSNFIATGLILGVDFRRYVNR
jgi:rod shape determining protein RodA